MAPCRARPAIPGCRARIKPMISVPPKSDRTGTGFTAAPPTQTGGRAGSSRWTSRCAGGRGRAPCRARSQTPGKARDRPGWYRTGSPCGRRRCPQRLRAGDRPVVEYDSRSRRQPDSCRFHIIHAVEVWKNSRSDGPRSQCRRCSLRCSSRVPPAPCRIHFGATVVPEDNSTNSG